MYEPSTRIAILAITASLTVTACAEDGGGGISPDEGNADIYENPNEKPKRKCHLIENLSNAAATSSVGANSPSLAVGRKGHPVVAWAQGEGIYVSKFVGSAWRRLIDQDATTRTIPASVGGHYPSVTVDHDGAPIVAWRTGLKTIHVRRFADGKWHELGGSGTGEGVSTNVNSVHYSARSPSIVVDHDNRPTIAFTQNAPDHTVRVRRFNGTEWQDVGETPFETGLSEGSRLAVDKSGQLVVSWLRRRGTAAEVLARRFDGSVWQEVAPGSGMLPGISNSNNNTTGQTLVTGPSGLPILAWQPRSGEVHVRELADYKLSPVGSGVASTPFDTGSQTVVEGFDLTVDQNDQPAVAVRIYTDDAPNVANIHVGRFDGKTWSEIPGSRSNPRGISNRGGNAVLPSLVIDGDDNVIVAWQQFGSSGVFAHRPDVYVAVVGEQHCR